MVPAAPRPRWSARRRALPRGGGVSSLGGGAGAGAVPAHYLPPTHPQRQECYPPGGGNPGPPQAGSFGVSPHLPDQTGARGGRGGGRAWESGWDEGVPFHGDLLRGDCRDPWEAEEPWGSGPFEQQVGPGAVL